MDVLMNHNLEVIPEHFPILVVASFLKELHGNFTAALSYLPAAIDFQQFGSTCRSESIPDALENSEFRIPAHRWWRGPTRHRPMLVVDYKDPTGGIICIHDIGHQLFCLLCLIRVT